MTTPLRLSFVMVLGLTVVPVASAIEIPIVMPLSLFAFGERFVWKITLGTANKKTTAIAVPY